MKKAIEELAIEVHQSSNVLVLALMGLQAAGRSSELDAVTKHATELMEKAKKLEERCVSKGSK